MQCMVCRVKPQPLAEAEPLDCVDSHEPTTLTSGYHCERAIERLFIMLLQIRKPQAASELLQSRAHTQLHRRRDACPGPPAQN